MTSASGARDGERPAARGPVVRELQVEADYGQIYIYDPEAQVGEWNAAQDEDDNPLFRAMEDGYESRRFVGYDSGLIDLIAPKRELPPAALAGGGDGRCLGQILARLRRDASQRQLGDSLAVKLARRREKGQATALRQRSRVTPEGGRRAASLSAA